MPGSRPVTTPAKTLALLLALMLALALAGCSGSPWREASPWRAAPASAPSSPPTVAPPPSEPDLAEARSEPRSDSVYPDVGDPLVDALHYELDLTWTPGSDRLEGRQRLTFRASADSPDIRLDFNEQLAISEVTVDGTPVEHSVRGYDLRIAAPVAADEQYVVELAYAGTPEPAPAPSARSDFASGVGWNVTDEHETWTVQEPYGAFTWYAVNDHPSDKAFYDFVLTSPDPMVGVANGQLVGVDDGGGLARRTWHLAEPASSYLVTVAFGDLRGTELTSAGGVPVQVWTDRDDDPLPGGTGYAAEALDWLEEYLGPYPFDSFGIVVVDNENGMETQTMVTLGDTPYSLSPEVVVHEAAHHWYGNTVSPADWAEVWMNEGMAMYLQAMWEAEQDGVDVAATMDEWAGLESQMRRDAGPPGAYDPEQFGDGNIYYGPALMWHELREEVGDTSFFRVLREWPARKENGNAERDEYLDWIEQTTGEELSAFFDAWLLGATTPDRD
ncbi:M1 family metallopeptidase [Nocardioides sp. zg-536]|uniref:Aminopeptidase N n=1 Tax=Nocardioides faecalis TaxID=2803858 RepID=A0A939BRG2_9ACTN|nr:M1 family metallopeptidase [Nocardioides faecalis]MBM9458589.1 M1 family metallopeptidase [Nocardioides faecalis]QVI58588.1 M1 family metallopeptidase [Nocardioides faecalis]